LIFLFTKPRKFALIERNGLRAGRRDVRRKEVVMSLFVDKFNRRKSPIALAAFGAALLDLLIFAVCYALLAEPLYRAVSLENPFAATALHAVIISLAGTAACCLLFLLPDKRVVPYGFGGLAAVLGMFYAAALLLEPEAKGLMLYLITLYGLAPVLVGNAVSWSVYRLLRPSGPVRRKTIPEELRDAIAEEAEKKGAPPPPPREGPAAPQAGPPAPGPRSALEEAMLLYEDDDDETSDH